MVPTAGRALAALGVAAALAANEAAVAAGDRTAVEQHICRSEKEFISAYKAAIHNPAATVDWNRVAKDRFVTLDSRVINGLVWKSPEPRGYLLVAQGTSMLAAEIYEALESFRSLGLDVYLYDYRGYGMSGDGNTSLNALISDYRQRISELNADSRYRYQFLYGLSVGGVLLSNALRIRDQAYSGFVLDSVPHAIPWYIGCPDDYDPVEHLPQDCKRWMVIAGGRDRVVGSRAEKLITNAKVCGAESLFKASAGHIFMDDAKSTIDRLSAARRFICDRMGETCQ